MSWKDWMLLLLWIGLLGLVGGTCAGSLFMMESGGGGW